MVEGEAIKGPIESFLKVDVPLDSRPRPHPELRRRQPHPKSHLARQRINASITRADPPPAPHGYSRPQLLRPRRSRPPGTGKSQTITNIIGDHLIRGSACCWSATARTALDVVADRLEHMGLGKLCGLVHDPQRDQRDLYRALREQLENLADTTTDARAEARLAKVDEELQQLHDELLRHWSALMEVQPGSDESFHNLMGRWLGEPQPPDLKLSDSAAALLNLADLDKHQRDVREVIERASRAQYPKNQWVEAHGLTLQEFLARPMNDIRSALSKCLESAHATDQTIHPAIPPFDPTKNLDDQARTRADLADRLEQILKSTAADTRLLGHAARSGSSKTQPSDSKTSSRFAPPFPRAARSELRCLIKDHPPAPQALSQQIAVLANYIEVSSHWYGFFAFLRKSAASAVLRAYGLALESRASATIANVPCRHPRDCFCKKPGSSCSASGKTRGAPSDDSLLKFFSDNSAIVNLLDNAITDPALQPHAAAIKAALTDPTSGKISWRASNILPPAERSSSCFPSSAPPICSLQPTKKTGWAKS
jgi:hypothetical protein